MCFTPIHQAVCLTWYHWTMSSDGGPSQIVGWQKNRKGISIAWDMLGFKWNHKLGGREWGTWKSFRWWSFSQGCNWREFGLTFCQPTKWQCWWQTVRICCLRGSGCNQRGSGGLLVGLWWQTGGSPAGGGRGRGGHCPWWPPPPP